MSLGMSLCVGQHLRLRIREPMYDSIFIKADELLEKTDYQKAIRRLLPKGRHPRFRSIMDAIFCEIFPWHRSPCLEFYRGGSKKQAKDILTKAQIKQYDAMLCVAIHAAHMLWQRELEVEWGWYHDFVVDLFQ